MGWIACPNCKGTGKDEGGIYACTTKPLFLKPEEFSTKGMNNTPLTPLSASEVKDLELSSLRLAVKAKDQKIAELRNNQRMHRKALTEWFKEEKIPERLLQCHLPLTESQQATLKELWERAMENPV